MDYLQSREFKPFNESDKKNVLEKLNNLKNYFCRQYQKCKSHYNLFENKCGSFLAADFDYEFEIDDRKVSNVPKGRKKKNFHEKSEYRKRLESRKLAANTQNNSELLLRAAYWAAMKEGKKLKASSIISMLKNKKIRQKARKVRKV
jgi:hypothetical protein